MATRVTKTGSTDVEFTTAPQPWQIAELDGDLDQIFANIDNSNIKAGAAIATSKIAADGGITTAYLANGAVTTPKIADASVTPAKLSFITGGAPVTVQIGIVAGLTITTEQTVATLPSITIVTGQTIMFFGTAHAIHQSPSNSGLCTATWRLKRGATTIFTWDFLNNFAIPTGGGQSIPIPTPQAVDKPTGGTYIYTLTLTNTGVAGSSIL